MVVSTWVLIVVYALTLTAVFAFIIYGMRAQILRRSTRIHLFLGLGLSALGVLGLIALVAAGATVELVVPQVALTLGGFAVTYVNWLSLRLRAPS